MHIEELEDEGKCGIEKKKVFKGEIVNGSIVILDLKRVLVGAGALALFYPTLFYNVVRNKIQAGFRWWDWVEEFVLLGAVPFPSDVVHLKNLGVHGVITLNEPYETLVPTSLYAAYGIHHLVLPTRDYLFAPSHSDICQAVNFIHELASHGKSTYVHCKAGRGRSTTIVICYLVQHKQMTPEAAYSYVKSIRPRVLLAASQWKAVQEYYCLEVKPSLKTTYLGYGPDLIPRPLNFLATQDTVAFDDGSVVVITKKDLDGYNAAHDMDNVVAHEIWADLRVIYRIRDASQTAFAKLSCFWVQCQVQPQASRVKMPTEGSCPANELGVLSVDISVY